MEKRRQSESTKVLERGLNVLQHVVRTGMGSVREISAGVGMSRPAVYRIMESLHRGGWVYRNSHREAYRVTSKALDMSVMLPPEMLVAEAARPVMNDLTKRTQWPVLLGYNDDVETVIVETTDHLAKQPLRRIGAGERIPQYLRGAGAACRSCLAPEEAKRVNKAIIDRYGDQLFSKDEAYREALLDRVRKRGFVIFEPLRSTESSAAVPVKVTGGLVFGLELRFIGSMVKTDLVKAQFVPMLEKAAAQIARRASAAIERCTPPPAAESE